MSIKLMCLAFDSEVPATQKLVLLALCDNANEQGQCFPSIALLERKCSLSDRAVQSSLSWLEQNGYLSRNFRVGRATIYVVTPERGSPPNDVHPRSSFTPPPNDVHPTPERGSPRTIREPSVEPSLKPIAASARTPTPPPAPFAGEQDLDRLNGRHVVALSVGWELPTAWGIDAESLGWKPSEVVRESEKFRQYWTQGKGKDSRRSVKGWRQSWSNWLSNAEKYKR